jgi:hypothetical protein
LPRRDGEPDHREGRERDPGRRDREPPARRQRPSWEEQERIDKGCEDRHEDPLGERPDEVAWALLGRKPTRAEKVDALRRLQEMGVFLIDTRLDPDDGSPLDPHVAGLIGRCRLLRPEHVVLIATPVYDAAYERLEAAGIPVVDRRIAFPSTGRQRDFRRQFLEALGMVGWPIA